jgi:hypothetical protein
MSAPVAACWRGDNARRIFVTEALEGVDSIFLATHSPIRGFEVGGRDAAEIDGDDEQSVLDALSAKERGHAFCVVQGEPGSGKSHLIRWLSVNWPQGNDVKLLLRRADGSLDGALRQLKERLPPEFERLFDSLGQRQSANLKGRANVFAATLGVTLEPDHFSKPVGFEKWCTEFAPADLIGFPEIRKAWKGPERILNLLEGAGGERNSASAAFDLFDIENLADACARYLKPSAVDARARELARRLEREAETIRVYREKEWRAEEIAEDKEAAQFLGTSITLMQALNKRKNEAIRNVMGVSAEALKTLFRNVREALAGRGERLVLLLEDITSWEGLDDSLMDVLVDNAEAHGGDGGTKICPLISVVGVTPDFYDRLPGNSRQRITHEIKLGQSTGSLQDVATKRESVDRRAFVTRYLAAVRAGLPALESWREEQAASPGTPPPNACEGCERRPSCFATFGDEDGVGLFPFTANALDRFFEALKENDNGQTWRTPRGLLQAVLNPNLTQPETIAEARFPGALIESKAIREDRRSDHVLSNRLERIISARIADPGEQARMRRLLAYWADPARAETTLEDEELAFAGARRSLFDAFGLEWLGADEPTAESAQAAPFEPAVEIAGAEPAVPLLADEDEETDAQSESAVRNPFARAAPAAPRPPVNPRPPQRLAVKRGELETAQHQLRNWVKGGAIANPSSWNKLLYELIRGLDPRRLGVSPYLFDRIVTGEMVKLEGSTTGSKNYLVVGAESWVRDGLEAYLSLRLDRSMSRGDAAFHRRNLAVMMRRLEKLAAAYVDSRMPKTEEGKRWSPIAGLAQVLVARAWLRGAIAPEASVAGHMSALLSDEVEAASDPRARSAPWQDWLAATDKWHERLRIELRGMVSLAIADGAGGAGLTDASELAGAIERMRATGQVDPVPAEDGGLPELMRRGRELAALWRDKRALVDRTEAQQLKNRSESLFALLRGRSVADHFARVDDVVTKVARALPEASSEGVQAWKLNYARLKQRFETGADQRLEQFLVSIDDEEDGLPPKLAPRLGWMANAPAKDLSELLEFGNFGERLIAELLSHVRDCVREASGTGSLAEVKRIGAALKAASGNGEQQIKDAAE